MCVGLNKAFVSMSAQLSEDAQCATVISPVSMRSRVKWWRMSMCLEREWNWVLYENSMAERLSVMMGVAADGL